MAARASREDGFGLVELMIALTVLAIGIVAIAAGFSSGVLAVSRASQTSSAGTIADRQMEAYRALPYTSIALGSCTGFTGNPWTPLTTCAHQGPVRGPDVRDYAVDTAVLLMCPLTGAAATGTPPTCAGSRPVQRVTVTVGDCATGACLASTKTFFTETSTFDQAT